MKRGAKNTSQLFLRLPPELLEVVEAAATANLMGLSEYVRRCLFEAADIDLLIHDNERLQVGLAAAENEIDRLRGVLEIIAGSATDKLQAMQATAALDNIGPSMEKPL